MSDVRKKYVNLITSFVDGDISASAFESAYLRMFKEETEPLSELEYQVLDSLFSSVDAFCEDVELIDDDDIDEIQLFEDAQKALLCLNNIKNS
jgi:hypothetical protein